MKNYKGYYIDHVYFNSEAEIDEHIKAQKIKWLKMWMGLMVKNYGNDYSLLVIDEADKISRSLVHDHGMSWSEIEEIELEGMTG